MAISTISGTTVTDAPIEAPKRGYANRHSRQAQEVKPELFTPTEAPKPAPTPAQPDPVKLYKAEVAKEASITQELTRREKEQLISNLNEKMSMLTNDLRFGFNDQVDLLEVAVINVKTDRVIRRFPTEDAVKLMTSMKEFVGLLFDAKG